MKGIGKLKILVLISVALVFAFGGSAMAFHGTGLVCNQCHTMHNYEDGAEIDSNGPYPHLLLHATTDLCLTCHMEDATPYSDGTYTAPYVHSGDGSTSIALSGGDYWSSDQVDATFVGARGHNPGYVEGSDAGTATWSDAISEDGHTAESRTPPGSSVAVGQLAKWDCVSCHAPHRGDGDGSYQYGAASTFRMLWSKPAGKGTGVNFNAIGDNGSGTYTWQANETDTNHTAYVDNVAAWCGQCHDVIHTPAKGGSDWLRHPTGYALPTAYASNYEDTTQGSGNGYSFIVPIQEADANITNTFTISNPEVMCLSCHRAHSAATNSDEGNAVGTANMTRWNMDAASGANSNCNKCHSKGS